MRPRAEIAAPKKKKTRAAPITLMAQGRSRERNDRGRADVFLFRKGSAARNFSAKSPMRRRADSALFGRDQRFAAFEENVGILCGGEATADQAIPSSPASASTFRFGVVRGRPSVRVDRTESE
jgi:hypothetical protein